MGIITIRDVAKECNISVATVSRVLGGSKHPVSDSVRVTVEEAANRLGYSPNILARSLKKNSSNEIAVLTPSVVNPFYTSIIKGIENRLWSSGYGMILYITGLHGRSDEEVMQSLRGKMVAGVIAASDSVSDEMMDELIRFREEAGVPLVFVDYRIDNRQRANGVFFDYEKCATMVADYLLEKGHRSIVFATTPTDRRSRIIRYEQFKKTMLDNGIPFGKEQSYICQAETSFQAGQELGRMIVNSSVRPTAVAAINDTVAVGILASFAQSGVKVPEDISVIGFDNLVFSEMCYPPLTTLSLSSETMGELAAEHFLDEATRQMTPHSQMLEASIVERQSVLDRNK